VSTLKEAVESGRRWRHSSWYQWAGPGAIAAHGVLIGEAVSSDFEIEPELEKPGEWFVWLTEPDRSMPKRTRVHDADACDRLHKNCDVPR